MTEWKTKFEGEVRGELASQKFLVDELWDAIPAKEKKPEKDGSKASVEQAGFSDTEIGEYTQYVNAKLKVNIVLLLKEIIFKKIKFAEMRTGLDLNNMSAIVSSSMKAYGGAMTSYLQLDMNVPGLGYSLDGTLSGVLTGEFVNAGVDSFFSGWIADLAKDKISGAAEANFWITGKGSNVKAIKQNLVGKVDFKLIDGKLKNWSVLSDGLKALGVNSSGEIPFRQMTGKTTIKSQKVYIDELKVVCDDARYNLGSGGWVGFDKDLDSEIQLPIRNDFSPSISSKLGDAGKFAAGQDGWLPVDFDVFGRMASPSFKPNMDRSLKNAGQKLEVEAKKKVEEEGKKAAEELKKKGEQLLKGLFGK